MGEPLLPTPPLALEAHCGARVKLLVALLVCLAVVGCNREEMATHVEPAQPASILQSAYAQWDLRAQAIRDLRARGREALLPLAMDLAAHLRQDKPEVARLASAALIDLGADAAQPLVAQADNDELRMMALQTLKRVPVPAPVVEQVVAESRSPELARRLGAIEVLGAMARSNPAAVEGLAGSLADSDAIVRLSAMRELAEAGPVSPIVIAQIGEKLVDPEPAIQGEACRTLFRLGKNASPALRQLEAFERRSAGETRELARLAQDRIECLAKGTC